MFIDTHWLHLSYVGMEKAVFRQLTPAGKGTGTGGPQRKSIMDKDL